MISNNISKAKLKNKKPEFVTSGHWKMMWEYWNTSAATKASKTNSKNRKSERGGDGMYVHSGGSKPVAKTKYEMMIEAGGEEPAIIELIRKVHTKKDGTFVDKRAQKIVEEVERIVVERVVNSQQSSMQTDQDGSNTQGLITSLMLDEVLSSILQPHKGKVYGLGTAQMPRDSNESSVDALPNQTRCERKVENLSSLVSSLVKDIMVMSQSMGIEMPQMAEQSPNPSTQSSLHPSTQSSPGEYQPTVPSPSTSPTNNEETNMANNVFGGDFFEAMQNP